jgi:hypothetical protein
MAFLGIRWTLSSLNGAGGPESLPQPSSMAKSGRPMNGQLQGLAGQKNFDRHKLVRNSSRGVHLRQKNKRLVWKEQVPRPETRLPSATQPGFAPEGRIQVGYVSSSVQILFRFCSLEERGLRSANVSSYTVQHVETTGKVH